MRLSISIILSVVFLLSPAPVLAQPTPARVGAILPLTGRAASLGQAIRNGIMLRYDTLSAGQKQLVSLKIEDDGSESRNSIAAYRKLASEGVNVVISAMSNSGHALTPLTERDGVTHISIAIDPTISDGAKATFTAWAAPQDLVRSAIAELKRRRLHQVALIVTQHEGNIAMKKSFMAAAEAEGVAVVYEEEVLPNETDFSLVVQRLRKKAQIEIVGNLLHPSHAGLLVRAMSNNKYAKPLFALVGFEDLGVRKDAGEFLLGSWYTAADYSPGFVQEYKSKFPTNSITGAPYGYDALGMVADHIERKSSNQTFAEYLKSIRGYSGAITDISTNGRNGFNLPIVVKVVGEDGL